MTFRVMRKKKVNEMLLLEHGIVPDGPSHNDPVGPPGPIGLGSTSDVLAECISLITTAADALKRLKEERIDADARID